jgi:serine/threonine kinase 16
MRVKVLNNTPIMETLLNTLRQLVNWILSFLLSFVERFFGPVVSFDGSRQVRVGRKIAEGGFSYVFRATDTSTNTIFALKRIQCQDNHTLQECRKEAQVHHAVANCKYTLQLLGVAYQDKVCWMLFPYMPHSLRAEVNKRMFPNATHPYHYTVPVDTMPPWSEMAALQIFRGIIDGVDAMHRANYSHCDVKLENVLFTGSHHHLTTPVLMDFGSVGPLTKPLNTRQDAIQISETASTHTTMPYRPPELFPGEVRAGDADLDYTKVDVWSLGCTLFAMLYGASPFESEFHRSTGQIKIVECSQLRVLGGVNFPPSHTPPARWYSPPLQELIQWMLTADRMQRPSLVQVVARVDAILHQDSDPMDVLL